MTVNWLRPQTLSTLVCRPALPRDTPDALELTRTIWQGEDYVPHVWPEWLADPHGLLAVAEWGGRAVGLSKLTRLSPTQWWLEGLRVHPDYEGRGIASRLHDYLVGVWERDHVGVLRLATASFRKPVHHLAERSGFRKAGECTTFVAPVEAGSPPAPAFTPLGVAEAPAALEFALDNSSSALTGGLMDLGWEWARPEAAFLEEAAAGKQAWWWRSSQGEQALLVFRDDEEEDGVRAAVQLLAGPLPALAACLRDFRQLAAVSGHSRVSWQAPLHPALAPVLEAAGFRRDWDASIYLYEKQHPARP
jgi:GNAT superfamily N-acetyltransferase